MTPEKFSGIYTTDPQPQMPITLPDKTTLTEIANIAIATLEPDDELRNDLAKIAQSS